MSAEWRAVWIAAAALAPKLAPYVWGWRPRLELEVARGKEAVITNTGRRTARDVVVTSVVIGSGEKNQLGRPQKIGDLATDRPRPLNLAIPWEHRTPRLTVTIEYGPRRKKRALSAWW